MKHFFPFLMIPFILCILLSISPMIPANAQQHDSFASAQHISVNQTITVTIPANASEYYYFHSLQTTKSTGQKYQIRLTDATSLSVSIFNDRSSMIDFTQSKSNAGLWIASFKGSSDNDRFFLLLHNETAQDVVTRLSIKHCTLPTATASPKPTLHQPKKAATPYPHKKIRQTSTPKCSEKKSKPKTSAIIKNSPVPKFSPVPKTGRILSRTATPVPSHDPEVTPGQRHTEKDTETQKPETTPDNQSIPTPVRSDDFLSSHFFRMSAGYSISLFELTQIDNPDIDIKYENITPKTISLQNNIIYAKTAGLAVIRIYCNNFTTSCTIYIQD